VPPEVFQAILERAGAIPLFVEELTKALLESRIIDAHGRARWSESEVPASLQSSLMERLDRLGSAKEVAQVAACIGREFDHALLAKVAALPGTDLDEAMGRLAAAQASRRKPIPRCRRHHRAIDLLPLRVDLCSALHDLEVLDATANAAGHPRQD